MDFARLFPPVDQDDRVEMCVIGGLSFSVRDVRFEPIKDAPLPAAVWVDGGSACLFSTPARAIGIVRVCRVRTEALTRAGITTSTYLVSITASNGSFLMRGEPLHCPDERIGLALQREIPRSELPVETTPEALLDIARTLAEHSIQAAPGEFVIHDGSVRSACEYLRARLTPAPALAKTTSILTSKSRPLGLSLLLSAPPGAWTAQLLDGVTCVRLHDRASHIFLVEQSTPALLALLRAWSADAAFPGYPYPFVLADQLARVSNNERDAWKVILASDEGAMRIIRGELRASDAHDMLEHILYGKQMF